MGLSLTARLTRKVLQREKFRFRRNSPCLNTSESMAEFSAKSRKGEFFRRIGKVANTSPFRLVSRSTGTCLADVNGDEVEAYLLESRRAALTSRRRRCAGQLGLRRASS